jgi:prefoldin subunit 5
MSTWKQDHLTELKARQAHIHQKLDHLRQLRSALQTLEDRLAQMQDWLEGLRSTSRLETFNPEIFIRMVSIGLFLRTAYGSMLAASGAPPPATAGTGDPLEAQRENFAQALQILEASGGLGSTVSLANFSDQFGITSEFYDGPIVGDGVLDTLSNVGEFHDQFGWQVLSETWNVFTSPFETYQRTKFTFSSMAAMETLTDEHGDDLDELVDALRDGLSALESIQRDAKWADFLDTASSELEDALADLEQAYDEAGGTGPSVSELKESAMPPEGLEPLRHELRATYESNEWSSSLGLDVQYAPSSPLGR